MLLLWYSLLYFDCEKSVQNITVQPKTILGKRGKVKGALTDKNQLNILHYNYLIVSQIGSYF
jgi:hypothetical protein